MCSKKVGEAGASRLEFVAGAGADQGPVGHEAAGAHGHQDDLKTVVEGFDGGGVGEDAGFPSGIGGGRQGQGREQEAEAE